jgi:hypothetical protein
VVVLLLLSWVVDRVACLTAHAAQLLYKTV